MKRKNRVYRGWEAISTEREKSDSYDSWVRAAADSEAIEEKPAIRKK